MEYGIINKKERLQKIMDIQHKMISIYAAASALGKMPFKVDRSHPLIMSYLNIRRQILINILMFLAAVSSETWNKYTDNPNNVCLSADDINTMYVSTSYHELIKDILDMIFDVESKYGLTQYLPPLDEINPDDKKILIDGKDYYKIRDLGRDGWIQYILDTIRVFSSNSIDAYTAQLNLLSFQAAMVELIVDGLEKWGENVDLNMVSYIDSLNALEIVKKFQTQLRSDK